jgi:hypothetical protein
MQRKRNRERARKEAVHERRGGAPSFIHTREAWMAWVDLDQWLGRLNMGSESLHES